LTTGSALLAFSSWFGFGLRRSRPISSRGTGARALFAATGTARALGSWSTRTNTRSHPRLAADAAEETGLGLFNNFDLRVVAVDAQVGEGSVRCFFD
jgi:hypothetical protein